MATSGSTDFSVTGANVVTDALRALGAIQSGETPTGNEMTDGLRTLNGITKQLTAPPNTEAPGLKLWKRRHLTLKWTATNEYVIKTRRLAFTSGGTTAIAVGDTITGETGGATAVIMLVELSSGTWAGGDAAGEFLIESQIGTFESETLKVGSDLNLATITANSSVYGPIVGVLEAVRRNSSGNDTPMNPITLPEWMAISDKDTEGSPQDYYWERRGDEFRIWLDHTPADVTETMFMVALMPVEDFDAQANDIDYPQEWGRALVFKLALDMWGDFPNPRKLPWLERRAGESMAVAQTFAPEESVMHFEPGRDE